MKRFPALALAAALITATFAIAAEESPRDAAIERGRQQAKTDIAAGKLAIESYGLMASSQSIYRDLLKERYGIQIRSVAGCLVSQEITGHAEGYNELMKQEISRRFGQDVLEKTSTEAREITRLRER